MNTQTLPFKIYPSRGRALLCFAVGLAMGVLVVVFYKKITATLPWYMYHLFYGLPLLAIAGGLKGGLFPKPVIVIYEDGLAYPQLGLRRLPWQDIRETVLREDVKVGGKVCFSPFESDRCLELMIAQDSKAFEQIRPMWRVLLQLRGDATLLPIGLMGSKTSTRELQSIINHMKASARPPV